MELSALLRRNWQIFTLIILACFFLAVYAWLHFQASDTFTSPDETANYFFSSLFSEKSTLRYEEPLNDTTGGVVAPRSVAVTSIGIVPGSFLGLPLLYGTIAKVTGSGLIFLFTPFFAVLGVICFYLLVKEFFTKNISFISSLLLFILPPYWYYSARGLFHNVLFLALLMIGLLLLTYALTKFTSKKAMWLYYLGSGLAIGLSLMTRSSEITWVIPIVVFAFLLKRKRICWRPFVGFVSILIIIFAIVLVANSSLYGSPLAFGYSTESPDVSSIQAASQSILLNFEKVLFPFGFDFERMKAVTFEYLITFFPVYALFILIGISSSLRKSILSVVKRLTNTEKENTLLNKKQHFYIWTYIATTLWLIIYYGSFIFYEYIDRSEILLGSSYLRYWLPIFVFGLPFCAMGIELIGTLFKKRFVQRTIVAGSIFLLMILSTSVVLMDPLQGLFEVKKSIGDSVSKLNRVLDTTESNAIIIAGHADKVFFPDRSVIVSLPTRNRLTIVDTVLREAPLYYLFNPLDSTSESVIQFFKEYDYSLQSVVTFNESNEILYSIQPR